MMHSRPFLGWRIVWTSMVAQALGPALFALSGVLITALEAEFATERAIVSLGPPIGTLIISAAGVVLGPFLDRGPIRAIMLAGVALMLGSLLGLSGAGSLWQIAALLAGASVGIAMYGALPAHLLVVHWFDRLRGRALAIAALGMSVVGFTLPPAGAWLLDRVGWRGTVAWVAIGAAAICAPLIWAFVVKRPEDVGQFPDGDAGREAVQAPVVRVPFSGLLRDPNFWLVGAGFGLAIASLTASFHLIPHGESLGLSRQMAAWGLSAQAGAALFGKLAGGWLADRVGKRFASSALLGIHALGWVLIATADDLVPLLLGAAVMGFGGGGILPLPPMFHAACFGRAVVGQVGGVMGVLALPFAALTGPLVGVWFDRVGNYEGAFYALAVVPVVALVLLGFVRFRAPDEPARHQLHAT
jgi:MFS family permease